MRVFELLRQNNPNDQSRTFRPSWDPQGRFLVGRLAATGITFPSLCLPKTSPQLINVIIETGSTTSHGEEQGSRPFPAIAITPSLVMLSGDVRLARTLRLIEMLWHPTMSPAMLKRNLVEWLRLGVEEEDGESISNWPSPLHRAIVRGTVEEISRLLYDAGHIRMAVLGALLDGERDIRLLARQQLELWREHQARIPSEVILVLELLSGNVDGFLGRCPMAIKWMVALHLILRFGGREMEVGTAIDHLDRLISNGVVAPPSVDSTRRDINYVLLRHWCEHHKPFGSFSLERHLHPASFSDHSLDWTRVWVLANLLHARRIYPLSAHLLARLAISLAGQLTGEGKWHLAIAILLYLANPPTIILTLLDQMMAKGGRASEGESKDCWLHSDEKYLVERCTGSLCLLPLLHQARAHYCHYDRAYLVEYAHLIAAKCFKAAGQLLLEQLASDAIIVYEEESLLHLVKQIPPAEQSGKVAMLAAYVELLADENLSVEERLHLARLIATGLAAAIPPLTLPSLKERIVRERMALGSVNAILKLGHTMDRHLLESLPLSPQQLCAISLSLLGKE